MFDAVKQGFTGLVLFVGQWLSPGGEQAGLRIEDVREDSAAWVLSCKMKIAWNDQLEQMVDAGIPLRFQILAVTDQNDSAVFYRFLSFNMMDYTYTYADSTAERRTVSQKYPLVYLALKDFCQWKFRVVKSAASCKITAVLLPSRVSRLNRMVDLSQLWGQRSVETTWEKDKPE